MALQTNSADHLAAVVIAKNSKPGTVVWGHKAVAEPDSRGYRDRQRGIEEAARLDHWGNPAYNLTCRPAASRLCVLTYGDKHLYFSGDTEAIPEMLAPKNIDVVYPYHFGIQA